MDSDGVLTDCRIETMAKGRVIDLLNEKLAEALRHCAELPNVDKVRELKVTIALKPVVDEAGMAVGFGTKINLTLPQLRGPSGRAELRGGEFKVLAVETSEERQTDVVDFLARKNAGE